MTVIVELPDLPELVAVIVAVPAATPVTTPLELTVAVEAPLVDQVTVWPVITLPEASLTVAVRLTVDPATTDAVGGATVTVVTTGGGGGAAVTVMLDVPDFPAAVAVIVTGPAAAPVTTPLAFTVATAASLVDQFTVGPVMTFPLASFSVA